MNLKHMLPFLDDEELADLAKKIAESPEGVYQGITMKEILPFVDEDDVDQMMLEGYKKGQDVHSCYPFASDEGLSRLVNEALKDDAPDIDFLKLIPFIEDEDIQRICEKILAKGGSFKGLAMDNLLPFMDDEQVDHAFLLKLKNHDPGAKNYAPFVSDEAYHELAEEYVRGELQGVDLDAFYPFMDEEDIRLIFRAALNEK